LSRVIFVSVLLAACAPTPALVDTASSSTIVRDPSTGHLWVTSPDDDALVEIDPTDGHELSRIAVAFEPQEVAQVASARVVTLGRASSVAVVDSTGVATISVPCGWTRSIASLGGRTFVTCPDDDRVLEIDVSGRRVAWTIELPGEPLALAIAGTHLAVTLARAHGVAVFTITPGVAPTPLSSTALPVDLTRAASQPNAIAPDPHGGFAVVYQSVANSGPRDLPVANGGYGSLVDGAPRIEPRVLGPCGGRYAVYDGGELAMSGPSAVAIGGGLIWIAHLYTDDVLVARCAPSDASTSAGTLDVLATFRVGRAPRGIVLSSDGHSAFVDLGFDWAVARLDAPTTRAPSQLDATWTMTRSRTTAHLSAAALRGRSLFVDGVNTHLTPSGVVTCGTCHPRGGEDGLSWFLHTPNVGPKLRRTLPAWGGRPSLAPFHWDGQFTDTATLAQTTMHELMNGDGLLVAFDDIAAYLAELSPPPPRPVDDAAAVMRGAALFASAGCASCHPGADSTDRAFHSVIPISSDAAAVLSNVDTPSLIAIRARSPFFHDGSAPTLRDAITVLQGTHTVTTALTPSDVDDLVTYLESL
jgi:DNA-binding beta-propeller fold protein YncE